ncbi:hypothetical protein [Streptomyces sp. NPDC095602]|uniref:phage terminase small subunit n=1 Tax=Streptomyces sp. NPDC095602 TaxID=3155819 RepID=UPI003325AC14
MPGNGPPPSENKRRRNKDQLADHAVSVPADDETVHGPELPYAPLYGPRTLDWYETWRRAPQAATFTATDWQRLHMLAPIVEAYWMQPTPKLLSEIRINESLLGATHVDRLRGRIKVEPSRQQTTPPPGVADLTARRRRISDAS